MSPVDRIRRSVWCRPWLATIALALGVIILVVGGWTRVTSLMAFAMFFLGLMSIGLRLVILQYAEEHDIDDTHCQQCGYDLTGNTSGVCPECGLRLRQYCEDCGDDATGSEASVHKECGQTVQRRASAPAPSSPR